MSSNYIHNYVYLGYYAAQRLVKEFGCSKDVYDHKQKIERGVVDGSIVILIDTPQGEKEAVLSYDEYGDYFTHFV